MVEAMPTTKHFALKRDFERNVHFFGAEVSH
jgi:hypothetical protein